MTKTKKNAILLVAIILIVLTILGSFFDYQIAKSVYWGEHYLDNIFGVIFSFIGIIPTFVGWSFLGASILCLSKKQVKNAKARKWLTAFSVLLFILSFFYFCNTIMMANNGAFSVHWLIAYPVGIFVILGATYLGYKLSKNSQDKTLLKKMVFLAIVSVVIMIIVSATKVIMDRPRYRFVLLMQNPEYFRNWWQSGSDIKNSVESALANNDFSSFPSGHSAYSLFAIFIFPALADFIPKLKKYKALLFIGGFIWWGLTAFSRLTVGAHYLTDVCLAGLLTIISYALVKLIFDKIEKRIAIKNQTKE